MSMISSMTKNHNQLSDEAIETFKSIITLLAGKFFAYFIPPSSRKNLKLIIVFSRFKQSCVIRTKWALHSNNECV